MNNLKFENTDLNFVIALTENQARARYSIGRGKLFSIADEVGANIRVGGRRLYSRVILDNYFHSLCAGSVSIK